MPMERSDPCRQEGIPPRFESSSGPRSRARSLHTVCCFDTYALGSGYGQRIGDESEEKEDRAGTSCDISVGLRRLNDNGGATATSGARRMKALTNTIVDKTDTSTQVLPTRKGLISVALSHFLYAKPQNGTEIIGRKHRRDAKKGPTSKSDRVRIGPSELGQNMPFYLTS